MAIPCQGKVIVAENSLITTQNQQQPADLPQEALSILRQRLLLLGVWPEAGDLFLELLPTSRWHSPPLTAEDTQWLPHVVTDALAGKDIGASYPAFFQKLVTNRALCQAVLGELDRRQGKD